MKKLTQWLSLLALCGSVFAQTQSGIEVVNFAVNPTQVTTGVNVTANVTFRITLSPTDNVTDNCADLLNWDAWRTSVQPVLNWNNLIGGRVAEGGTIYEVRNTPSGPQYAFANRPPNANGWTVIEPCANPGGNELFFFTASLSRDSTWGSTGSLGVNMTTTATPIAFSPNTSVALPRNTGSGRTYEVERVVTFTVPDNEDWNANGRTWFLLVRYGGNARNATQNPSSWTSSAIVGARITVSSNIHIVENTAYSNTRSSNTARLMIKTTQRLSVVAINTRTNELLTGSTTFNACDMPNIRLEARDPQGVWVQDANITFGVVPINNQGDGARIGGWPNNTVPLPDGDPSWFGNTGRLAILATATHGDYTSSSDMRWEITRNVPSVEIRVRNYDLPSLVRDEVITFDTRIFGHGASAPQLNPQIPNLNQNLFLNVADLPASIVNQIRYSLTGEHVAGGGALIPYNSTTGIRISDNADLFVTIQTECYRVEPLRFRFVRDLPDLEVVVTNPTGVVPSVPYPFNTNQLVVSLETRGRDGNPVQTAVIHYTITHANGTTTTGTLTLPNRNVTLTNDMFRTNNIFDNGNTVRITAWAEAPNSNYNPSAKPDREWIFVRNLPEVSRIDVADPEYRAYIATQDNNIVLFDTQVWGTGPSLLGIPANGNIREFIVIDNNGNTIPSNTYTIYYVLDANDFPTTLAGYQQYPPAGIAINRSLNLKVIAVFNNGSFATARNEWDFVQNLRSELLNLIRLNQMDTARVNPALNIMGERQMFRFEFDVTERQILRYNFGPAPIDSSVLRTGGKIATMETRDTLRATSLNDTIYVSAYVFGGTTFDPTYKVWKFAPDNLRGLVVEPTRIPEYKFTNSVTITAYIQNLPSNIQNFRISYTIDGTSFSGTIDNHGTITLQGNSDGSILIRDSNGNEFGVQVSNVTFTFTALADDRFPSASQTHSYRLTADGRQGWFYDTNGDGQIDRVVIHTTIPVQNVPDRIVLTSPWNSQVTVTVPANNIRRENDTTLVIFDPNGIFPQVPVIQRVTGFDPEKLATLSGQEYSDTGSVTIHDSIAPIAVEALYIPGKINEGKYKSEGVIERDSDTLIVRFSEPTSVLPGQTKIFDFYYGASLELRVIGTNGASITFEVVGDNGTPLRTDDSLRVIADAIRESKSGGVRQENVTIWIPIEVRPPSYMLVVTPISPITPGEPMPIIIADFLTIIEDGMGNLDASAQIIDATGNVVAQFSGLNGGGNLFAKTESFEITRTVSGRPVKFPQTTQIFVYWNGKNQAGRDVGAGAYWVIFSITGPDPSEPPHKESIMIGVGTAR